MNRVYRGSCSYNIPRLAPSVAKNVESEVEAEVCAATKITLKKKKSNHENRECEDNLKASSMLDYYYERLKEDENYGEKKYLLVSVKIFNSEAAQKNIYESTHSSTYQQTNDQR